MRGPILGTLGKIGDDRFHQLCVSLFDGHQQAWLGKFRCSDGWEQFEEGRNHL